MRDESIRRNLSAVQENFLILFNQRRADDAFAAHAALVRMEADQPELAENPAWQSLRADAFENFALAFEVAQ